MSGFEKLETAARVRDIIKKQTTKVIDQQVSRGLVGRVITMDPTRLKGMVWFPGDDQPIEVNFFPTTLPSSWEAKDRAVGGQEGTSTQGFGSMVRAERLNGLLYVTEVLTGGSFGYNTLTMGQTIIKQQPNVGSDPLVFPVGAGITGTNDEATLAVRVGFAANLTSSDRLFFGPFVRQDKQEAQPGTLEIIVRSGKDGVNGVKLYECPIVVANELKGAAGARENLWFRILPKHSSTTTAAGGVHDWDLDINVVDTNYSEVKGTSSPAFWLGITRRKGGPAEIYDVTVRSTAFDQVGGYNLAESFVQQQHADAPVPAGYLGFHNSNALYGAMTDTILDDTFNRELTSSWGGAFNQPGASEKQYQPAVGAASLFEVQKAAAGAGHNADMHYHGVHMYPTGTIANTTQLIRFGSTSDTYTDIDIYAEFAVAKMPAGAATQIGFETRYKNSGADRMNTRVDCYASGEVYVKTTKTVSSVFTNVGTDTLAITGWDQTQVICYSMRQRGNSVMVKAWRKGDDEPTAFQKSETVSDANLLTPGTINVFSAYTVGSTVTAPAPIYFERIRINLFGGAPPAPTNKPWSTGPWRDSMLRLGTDVQRTWYINGDFRWNGTTISWTGNIWMQGVGPNRNGLIYGRAGLVMPNAGEQIPIVPYGSATYATVTSAGIPLAPFQSLYLALQPGSIGGIYALEGQLFIVDSSANSINQDYYLPEWAVMIATASSLNGTTSPDLRLGNGQHLSGNRKMLAFAQNVISTGTVAVATTATDIPGLAVSMPINSRGAVYEVTATLDVNSAAASGTAVFIGELLFDGAADPAQLLTDYESANKRVTITRSWLGTLSPKAAYANYALKITGKRGATAIDPMGGQHCTMSVKVFE